MGGRAFKATLATLALGASHAAMAQTAEPVPQTVTTSSENPPPEEASGLTDIIVTAQRREETAQRAAVAIDVVSAADLASAGVITAASLNAAAPSLTVQQGGGANTTFFVRGVGNFTNNGYSDPAVAFNLDGVYLGRPTSTTGTFFDLERIEVLKGPQGTLYGRNATAGAINVIPVRPKIGETSTAVQLGYGNYDAKDIELVSNIALGSQAALRVSGKIVDRDGYNEDGTSDEKGQGLRVQLLVQPTDTFTMRIAADYSHQGGIGVGASYLGVERFTPGSPATPTSPPNYTFQPANLGPYSGLLSPAARAFFARQVIPGSFINPAPLKTPYLDNHYWGVTAEFGLETGIGTVTLIPAVRRSTLDLLFNGPSFQGALTREKDDQGSVELRLQGKRVGMFDWLAGIYYFDERVDGKYGINQYQITSFQDFTSDTQSYAAFGRITANVSDAFRLVGGGRYTQDKKQFDGAVQTLVELCAAPPPPTGPGCFGGPSVPVVERLDQVPGAPTIPGPRGTVPYGNRGNILFFIPNQVNAELSRGRFTYRLAAEYDLAPRSLLYASYETGYRSGGFSTAVGRETFQPEFVDAYTIGSKNRLFDNKVQLNIEAFYWKYRNQQVSHFGVDGTGNSNYFTENIGSSTLKGIDVEAQVLATRNTLLSATVQYLDSKVERFTYFVPRGPTSLPPVSGCAVSPTTQGTAALFAIDCAGKPSYNSPRWSINAGLDQTIPLDTVKVVVSGEGRYRSNAVIGFDYLPQQNTGNNWSFDASVALADMDDRWSITGFVRNITDNAIKTFAQFADTTGESLSSTFTPPRTYGLRVGYKFR
ncbi:MAG TPA: TonB-dependent receptor [Sphingomonas sp.]|jgi:iron complex outermembrane receptor protein|nr:TonB-dependent receptor [Sphingomonas sp.]